jgi:hypothetical protein
MSAVGDESLEDGTDFQDERSTRPIGVTLSLEAAKAAALRSAVRSNSRLS